MKNLSGEQFPNCPSKSLDFQAHVATVGQRRPHNGQEGQEHFHTFTGQAWANHASLDLVYWGERRLRTCEVCARLLR